MSLGQRVTLTSFTHLVSQNFFPLSGLLYYVPRTSLADGWKACPYLRVASPGRWDESEQKFSVITFRSTYTMMPMILPLGC